MSQLLLTSSSLLRNRAGSANDATASTHCPLCPAGRSQSGTAASNCTVCPLNYVAGADGSTSCSEVCRLTNPLVSFPLIICVYISLLQCRAPSYQSTDGGTVCFFCENGKYAVIVDDKVVSPYCLPCPDGAECFPNARRTIIALPNHWYRLSYVCVVASYTGMTTVGLRTCFICSLN